MKLSLTIGALACLTMIAGCAQPPFPAKTMENVAPVFDFRAWKEASPTNNTGKSDEGTKVQLGGRIIQADPKAKGVLIIAEQMPIVNHPVYGPADPGKRVGEFQFALLFPGQLDPSALRDGNRFIVVGTTKGRKSVVVEGAPKTEPYLVAECIHIWQTGRSEIAAFKESAGAGASTLPEQTYCAQGN